MSTGNSYKFDCGCELPILDPAIKDCDGLPSLDIDFYNLPQCPKIWELFHSGRTKGIWQLERNLGQQWAASIKPNDIEEIAALISVIRPGVLNSIEEKTDENGKVTKRNMTQVFSDRKNGLEEVKHFHKSLEPILKDTFSIIVFQEQCIKIVKELAGFTLQEADTLRKGIGKKDVKIILEMESLFLSKAKDFGVVNEEEAKQIFAWIKESNRYSFNKCLDTNTTVQTVDNIKTLNDLKIGDKVLAPKLDGTNTFVEVVNIYHNGKRHVFEFTLEDNNKIICTLDHRFFASDLMCTIEYAYKNGYSLLNSENKRLKIVDCNYVGYKETIDIEVDSEYHLFYANDLVCSNSHAVAYAELGYWSAFVKYHFPLHFYVSWLHHRKDTKDENEAELLVNDAKIFDIQIGLPSLLNLHDGDPCLTVLKKHNVYLGVNDIKRFGESSVEKFIAQVNTLEEKFGPIEKWSWMTYLVHLLAKTSSTVVNGLISAGALNHIGKPRTELLFEYNIFRKLTDSQVKILAEYDFPNLEEALSFLLSHKKTRNLDKIQDLLKVYRQPPYSLKDGISVIADMEQEYLGLPISCTRLDSREFIGGDTTCIEYVNGKNNKIMNIAVEITSARENIIKTGKSIGRAMGFVNVTDGTATLNVVAFAEMWEKNRELFYKGNTLLISGKRSSKGSFQIEKVKQI